MDEPVGVTGARGARVADAAPPHAASADAAPPGARPRDPAGSPRRRRRLWRRALLTALVVLVVATGWLVVRGVQAATALMRAEQIVGEMRTGLSGADPAAVISRLPELEAAASQARSATADPVWRAASRLPSVGPNLAAVATVSAALDDVARDALQSLDKVARLADLQGLRDPNGRIDLEPLVDAAPALASAAATAREATASMAAIDTSELATQLAGPVERVQSALAGVSDTLAGAARLTALLPPMLGADGPRTYLLLSLNSAELRSAGGIVGAVAVLRAEGGAVELLEQRTTVDFRVPPEPILPLTDEERRVHTDRLGRYLQNTVLTPDFPRTAELVTAFWRNNGGGEVDGVIATDPIAVSYLLAATGAVVEPGGRTLDQANVVAELLHDSYLRLLDPLDTDAFFTGVASTIFGAISSGEGDARTLLTELGRASGEHRVRVWSARPQEQASLLQTSAGGAFLSGGADDAAGLFLNDGTAGKVDYFLRSDVTIEELRCEATTTTATVRLDLTYEPPADITDYPRYVTGSTDLPAGWVATNLTVYAPVGGTLGPIRTADGVIGGLLATERGRAVEVMTSRLQPGESATYRFEIRTLGPMTELPVWLTPTISSPGLVTASCG